MAKIFPRTFFLVFLFCLLHGCSLYKPFDMELPSEKPQTTSHVCWPSAHRGNRQAATDNSIQAINSAAQAGIPLIEIDVRMTEGGGLYLFHDRRLRPENYSGPINLIDREFSTLTVDELGSVRLPRVSSPVPSLRDALMAVKPYPSKLQLDIKGETKNVVEKVVALIQSQSSGSNVIIQCQSFECLKSIRYQHPDIHVLARAHCPNDLREILKLHPDIVQIDSQWATYQILEAIHASGAKVLVKTLGTKFDHAKMWWQHFELGIDYQLTDYPLQMKQLISQIPHCKALVSRQ